MAYAATITSVRKIIEGIRYWIFTITETGNTGVGDEADIEGVPTVGTVTHVQSTVTLGGGATATQADPQIGEATNSNSVYENATAGLTPDSGSIGKTFVATDNTLTWRAKADGTLGTGGTIVSKVVIREGHHPV
jgi:hypothetical protein